tara:strand:- start:26 stop:544 length:519 start_codon:yes stop_codon:yes gene_type:complete
MASTLKIQNIAHTGGTTAMTLDSSGRVTTPTRPAFHVRLSSSTGATGVQGNLVFNEEDFDIGSNYDTSNGRFTAPIAGIYFFSFDALVTNSSGGALPANAYTRVRFLKNGSSGLFSQFSYNFTGTTQYNTINRIDCIQLSANDYIQVQVQQNHVYTDATGEFDPVFQGFLIG